MSRNNGNGGPPTGFYQQNDDLAEGHQMTVRVTPDNTVEIRFSSRVRWIRLRPEMARKFAHILLEYASRAGWTNDSDK